MNYDKIVNKFLTEAYFGSPWEKANSIKRQAGHMMVEEQDPEDEARAARGARPYIRPEWDAFEDMQGDKKLGLSKDDLDEMDIDEERVEQVSDDIEKTLNEYIKNWQGQDKKKKSALDKALDVAHQLPDAAQKFLWKLQENKVKYQEGGKIRSEHPEYTKLAGEWDEQDFAAMFSDAILICDPETGYDAGRWTYQYPGGMPEEGGWDHQVRGNVDLNGFMIEAVIDKTDLIQWGYEKDQVLELGDRPPWGEEDPVLPGALEAGERNPWGNLNLFVAGVPVPIFTTGRGRRASTEG